MKAVACVLILAWIVNGEEPSIVYDSRPEAGVPREALAQMHAQPAAQDSEPPTHKWPRTLDEITDGTIKTVRIRYFNQETWATEEQAREYVRGYLANRSLDAFGFQVWSQGVGVPEIECFIEFTDAYWNKLREQQQECRDGRLLIWNTESCFRDATGRWWFVSAFDHFHRSHPHGDRKLAKAARSAVQGDGLVPSGLPALGLPVGKWSIEFTNRVAEVCVIREDMTVSVVEPLRSSGGKAVVQGDSCMIVCEDDRVERWTPAGKRFVVEHWSPGSHRANVTPVFGIAERAE